MKLLEKPIHMIVLIAVIVTTISGTGYYFYYQHQKSKQAGPEFSAFPVEVDRVRRGTLVRNISVVGTLIASNTVTIRANIRGQISRVFLQGGEEVRRGDLIFELDDRTSKAKLKEAQATLAHAQLEFNRAEQLAAQKFSPIKVLDKARADLLRAEAAVENSQKEVEDTKITAPYEGLLSLHKISVGALVGPDLDLVTITDVDPIKVDFKIPAKYLPFISTGQKVNLEVDNLKDQKFTGEIEAIDAQVDPNSQQIGIRASLENKKRLLKPGSFARVTLTAGSVDNALIVPAEAVEATTEQSYVYKVIEHPERPGLFVVFRVPVSTGIQEKDRIEISRGLFDNDIIVTVGQERVRDGTPVKFDLASVGLSGPGEKAEGEGCELPPAEKTAIEDTPTKQSTESTNSESSK